jgi:diguanylate cyclase (GGDEF)-like protein
MRSKLDSKTVPIPKNAQVIGEGRKALIEEQKLSLPAAILTLTVCLIMVVDGMFFEPAVPLRWYVIGLGLLGMAYTCALFYVALAHLNHHPVIKWVIAILNGAAISAAMFYEPAFASGISLVFIFSMIIIQTIVLGRWPTYLFALLVFFSDRFLIYPVSSTTIFRYFVESLPFPTFSIVAVETICRLRKIADLQLHRFKVLNMVARSVTSSLEAKQVVALLNSTIQYALDADTYYVGLLDATGKLIHLELLYDDGEFFPPTDLPLENTLAGWVLTHRKSLLTGNLPEELPRLGIKRFVVGKPKASQSWMGTPLQTRSHLFGLVAVASYRKNEFSLEDLQLLENVAQQASMAIDNANHHAEVEAQSQLDSLTKALNHGSFIKNLEEKIIDSEVTHMPTSLIMLDIDKFKDYNDNYGHLVGDQVLSRLTEVIHGHVRDTDLVGRWGGEEFCIALPGADAKRALSIARRIQQSMSEIVFLARDGTSIPAPTVSQGISVFPQEAADTFTLIDIADQRLYTAKNRGRNEIEMPPGIKITVEEAD